MANDIDTMEEMTGEDECFEWRQCPEGCNRRQAPPVRHMTALMTSTTG